MGRSRVFGTILGTAALIAGAGVLNAAPASAAVTGTCYTDRPCIWLYYNSAYEGWSITIGGGSISNLDGYTYPYAGAGKGLPVKNNAASAKMRADDSSILVHDGVLQERLRRPLRPLHVLRTRHQGRAEARPHVQGERLGEAGPRYLAGQPPEHLLQLVTVTR